MHYHFIGDQGISMSGLKALLEKMGNFVTGSDIKTGGHKRENISKKIDFVVRTSAVTPGSPGWIEVAEAKRLKIPVMKRSELIGQITKDKYLIAVSGMHGKTTVTSMIALAMIKAGFDPTILIGEKIPQLKNRQYKFGKSNYFLLEACEYDKSFLDFVPDIAVITNIDYEHPDTYPLGIGQVVKTFKKFVKNIKNNGLIIYWNEDSNLKEVIKSVSKNVIKIPFGKGTAYSKLDFKLKVFGEHNIKNTLASLAVLDKLGISRDISKEALCQFTGAKRRIEYKGMFKGMKIYDDYGHHPTEIAATLNALRGKELNKKIITVFWPHQYKRIKPLINQFAKSFIASDQVILKPIYFVPGRDEKLDVSSEDLVNKLKDLGVDARLFDSDDKIVKYIMNQAGEDKILLTIGIPPVYKIADKLVKNGNTRN